MLGSFIDCSAPLRNPSGRSARSNHRVKLHERSKLFIRTHNEALSVATCAPAIQIVRLLESIAEAQPEAANVIETHEHEGEFKEP